MPCLQESDLTYRPNVQEGWTYSVPFHKDPASSCSVRCKTCCWVEWLLYYLPPDTSICHDSITQDGSGSDTNANFQVRSQLINKTIHLHCTQCISLLSFTEVLQNHMILMIIFLYNLLLKSHYCLIDYNFFQSDFLRNHVIS